MKTIFIKSFEELLDTCSALNQEHQNEILFRGTSNQLIPSIVERCSFASCNDLAHKESSVLLEFAKFQAMEYNQRGPIFSDWELRISAREHGLISSLMDWTNSIEIATEFAIRNFHSKNIEYTAVWILVKSEINQINLGESVVPHFREAKEPSIVNYFLPADYSSRIHLRRKFIQGGQFLKQSYQDILQPLDTNNYFRDKLIKVVISKATLPKIVKNLSRRINLSEDSIVIRTSLDDACEELNAKYA